MSEFLCTADVARLLDLTPDAVRALERAGKLVASRTAGRVRIFHRADVERFAAERASRKIVK